LAKRANLVDDVSDRHVAQIGTKEDGNGEPKQTLLLLGIGEDQRLAIPLSLVSRLEEFPISSLERSNGLRVVQSNGQIIPLIHLREALNAGTFSYEDQKSVQVVVYSSNGQSVGVVVDRILDIVETSFTMQRTGKQNGVLGSAIVQNRVTDLLDIHHLLASTAHDFFGTSVPSLAI
jgi:two-component system chemotaxis sensor kinase CheA